MYNMSKVRFATVWLGGCSGCHMSFLDQDERLIDLESKAEIVYSPFIDVKEFPEGVEITLIEGAVGNDEQLRMLKRIRERSKILVSLGDCAVTGNVTALKNRFGDGAAAVLQRGYIENADVQQQIPVEVPKILRQADALHLFVKIDYFIPGCPPNADLINYVINELVAGRTPNMEDKSKYG
jgi:NAD-reducing hydrogenase small subunit